MSAGMTRIRSAAVAGEGNAVTPHAILARPAGAGAVVAA